MEISNKGLSNIIFTKDNLDTKLNSNIKRTKPFLTKYERARIIGCRAEQLANGFNASVDTAGITDVIKIAEKELNERKIPLIIQRRLPDGEEEYWKIEELDIQ